MARHCAFDPSNPAQEGSNGVVGVITQFPSGVLGPKNASAGIMGQVMDWPEREICHLLIGD